MDLRRIVILLLAVAAAGGTAMYARSWVAGQQASSPASAAPPQQEYVEVLVADVVLPAGSFVKPQHLRWQRWPTEDVPDAYLLKGEGPEQEVVGAVVRRGLTLGEPITDGSVAKPGDRGFLAAVLSPGTRAVSIPITPISANSGLIFPGDRVDLILTQTLTDNGDTRRVSETVMGDMRVIAMGTRLSDNPQEGQSHEKARTATLEVTPAQAEEVTLLTELGKLSLSLRSLATSEESLTVEARREPYTWDSEVSRVLDKSDRVTSHLLVLRGGKAENVEQGAN